MAGDRAPASLSLSGLENDRDLQMMATSVDSPFSIVAENLGKRFDNNLVALDGLNLQIPSGGFTTVLGPSGCGKSTLLRLIAGLTLPTSGRIIYGEPANPCPPVAFIFQDANLLPWLTVRDNIALPLQLGGVGAGTRRERARALASWLKLDQFLHFYPRQLSGGMRMRTSIARALITGPRLLLLDEPFAALDAITRNRLNEELLEMQGEQGWTAVFVTHSVQEAVFLSQQVVILGGHPGGIVSIRDIDLPFPRDQRTRESTDYANQVALTHRDLHRALVSAQDTR